MVDTEGVSIKSKQTTTERKRVSGRFRVNRTLLGDLLQSRMHADMRLTSMPPILPPSKMSSSSAAGPV